MCEGKTQPPIVFVELTEVQLHYVMKYKKDAKIFTLSCKLEIAHLSNFVFGKGNNDRMSLLLQDNFFDFLTSVPTSKYRFCHRL